MKDLRRTFHALDAGKDGFLQKEDLIEIRQRKRAAKRLKREARKNKYQTKLTTSKVKRSTKKWFGRTM